MNSSQGPGANGEGPSEWVERAMELADSFRLADELAGDEDEASESDADRAWRALRAHLECKEREHQSDREVTVKVCNEMGALQALVKQLAEALDMLTQEFVKVFPIYYYAEPWAHDQNAALKFARAALAAQQQHVATQEKK